MEWIKGDSYDLVTAVYYTTSWLWRSAFNGPTTRTLANGGDTQIYQTWHACPVYVPGSLWTAVR